MIKPILFNTDMVRAIPENRKTATRRLIKPQPDNKHTYPLGFCLERKRVRFGWGIHEFGGNIQYANPPYQTGDILYVRETWGTYVKDWRDSDGFLYRADYPDNAIGYWHEPEEINWCDLPKWKPSIHMPKDVARIFLKVTDVRAEQLHDMNLDDFLNEGIVLRPEEFNDPKNAYLQARKQFSDLWDSTIKKTDIDRYGWDANPWDWAIKFEQCEKPEEW